MSTTEPDEYDSPEVMTVELLRGEQAAFDGRSNGEVRIHYGWFNEDESRPEITVGNPDESPVNDEPGQTGYAGWRGDGSGPTQQMAGTVEAHLWTTTERSDVQPRKLLWLFAQEIRSILSANANAEGYDFGFVNYGGFRRMPPETEYNPTRWHGLVTVRYGYIE